MKASLTAAPTQLALTWLVGSLSLGTVALLFVAGEPPDLFRPLPAFSPLGLLALVGLFGVLFAGLLVTVWLTPEASWLAEGARGRVLWAAVAAVGVALVAVVAGVLIAEVGPYGVLGHYFQLLSTMFMPIFPVA